MDNDYAAAIKSTVADLCNIGSNKYYAGAITAGFFLKAFVGDTPWAHLDIAGTAFNVPDKSYYESGGTGVGVRLLVDVAMNWHK
jgi:leucyl aminopeptidase